MLSEKTISTLNEYFVSLDFFIKWNKICDCDNCDLIKEIEWIDDGFQEVIDIKDNRINKEYECFYGCTNCIRYNTNLFVDWCVKHEIHEISTKPFEQIGIIDFICND